MQWYKVKLQNQSHVMVEIFHAFINMRCEFELLIKFTRWMNDYIIIIEVISRPVSK